MVVDVLVGLKTIKENQVLTSSMFFFSVPVNICVPNGTIINKNEYHSKPVHKLGLPKLIDPPHDIKCHKPTVSLNNLTFVDII